MDLYKLEELTFSNVIHLVWVAVFGLLVCQHMKEKEICIK